MKAFLLFALFQLLVLSSIAQTARTVDDIINQKEVKKLNYILSTGLYDAVVINMQYGQAEVISNSDREALKKADIFQVDLVFSNYPVDFDMTDLNTKRIKVVEGLRKEAVSDPAVKWNLIRQMRCTNEAEAKVLFHGIVIHYRKGQSEEVSTADLTLIEKLLPTTGVAPKVESETRDCTKIAAAPLKASYSATNVSTVTTSSTLTLSEAKKLKKELPDSTVLKILDRNSWKNMVVVSDLTGSMSPYVVQLILWFKLNELDKRVSAVTFFNDGNRTPDPKKVIGNTGGIYYSSNGSYEDTRALAIKTIQNGFGGDGPENDFEAILAAMEKNPEAKEIILVADNLAPVKDFELLSKIDKPVHVILCGTSFGINLQYLKLARATGGSVHTMEKDLNDLAKLGEGKTFQLGTQFFKIVGGEITAYTPPKAK